MQVRAEEPGDNPPLRCAVWAASMVGSCLRLRAIPRHVAVRALLAIVLAALAPLAEPRSFAAAADSQPWEQWQHREGIVDVAGPRSDGDLVVVAAGRLFLVARDGATSPFAAAEDGFAGSVDGEPYLVVAPALGGESGGCAFVSDDVFILDLTSPPGVARVDPTGHAGRFATIPTADTLNGIVFDTTGRFGHRLLVTGTSQNRTIVSAIDCQGSSTTVTDSAPPLEGGLAVAPAGFGQYGGDLIAADENSGQLLAIGPDGRTTALLKPNLPTGGDTGVESLGFAPPGFSAGGVAYLSDRRTLNNPFPGTDSILRLSSQALGPAGVRDGDLLVATEGGGTTVAVRCDATCTASPVADGPLGGHIEGHIALIVDQPAATRAGPES